MRIEEINVSIKLDTGGRPEDVLRFFESHCIVTEEHKRGIPVSLTLNDVNDKELLKSH